MLIIIDTKELNTIYQKHTSHRSLYKFCKSRLYKPVVRGASLPPCTLINFTRKDGVMFHQRYISHRRSQSINS